LLGEITLPNGEELLIFADATAGVDVALLGVDAVYDDISDRISSPYLAGRWLTLGDDNDDPRETSAEGRVAVEARLAPSLLSVAAVETASRPPRAPGQAEWLGAVQFPAGATDEPAPSLALLRTPAGWIFAVELAWLGAHHDVHDPYDAGAPLRIRGFADDVDLRDRVRPATITAWRARQC
jgi:hypothetical protein